MFDQNSDPDDLLAEVEFILGLLRDPGDLRLVIRAALLAGIREAIREHPHGNRRDLVTYYLRNVGDDLQSHLDPPAASRSHYSEGHAP